MDLNIGMLYEMLLRDDCKIEQYGNYTLIVADPFVVGHITTGISLQLNAVTKEISQKYELFRRGL